MKRLNHYLQNRKRFSKAVQPLSRNRGPNITQNWHVCAMCCRTKVDCDVISGRNVKTMDCYVVVNIEVANFQYIKKIISWRLRQRRTSTIALSENAFEFRLTIEISVIWCTLTKYWYRIRIELLITILHCIYTTHYHYETNHVTIVNIINMNYIIIG